MPRCSCSTAIAMRFHSPGFGNRCAVINRSAAASMNSISNVGKASKYTARLITSVSFSRCAIARLPLIRVRHDFLGPANCATARAAFNVPSVTCGTSDGSSFHR